jgi:periodic tryptophan protein 1
MISSLAWVPRGAAKAVPEMAQPTEEELEAAREMLAKQKGGHGDDEDEEPSTSDSDMEGGEEEAVARARAAAAAIATGRQAGGSGAATVPTDSIEAAMRELDMEHYDDSEDENVMTRLLGGRGDVALDADGDPYITLGDDEEDSEDEDFSIKPTDLLILAARNEDDVSNLEVWVYEETDNAGEANVYVHHDILLPAFPLCTAWMDCNPSGSTEKANMVAVGTMEPGIEIWDLDIVDSVEPAATLGGELPAEAAAPEEADKKKKKKVRARMGGVHGHAACMHGAAGLRVPCMAA